MSGNVLIAGRRPLSRRRRGFWLQQPVYGPFCRLVLARGLLWIGPSGLSDPDRDATSERHGPRGPGAALPQRVRVGVRAVRARRRRHADRRRAYRGRGDPDSPGEPRSPPAYAHAEDRLTVPLTAVLPTAARGLAAPRGRRNSTLPPPLPRRVFFCRVAPRVVAAVGAPLLAPLP